MRYKYSPQAILTARELASHVLNSQDSRKVIKKEAKAFLKRTNKFATFVNLSESEILA
jgi:hypothetical protein